MRAKIMALEHRHVDKLLVKVNKLAEWPEEMHRLRAAIKKARGRAAALERLSKHVANSCVWVELAVSSIVAVGANRAPVKDQTAPCI